MNSRRPVFSCRDTKQDDFRLGFVIPTRSRGDKLEQTLKSLAEQGATPLRVVVVASGDNVEQVAALFDKQLEITYLHSPKSGQIHQRNLGIQMLRDENFDYIGFLDDDVIMQEHSLRAIFRFIGSRRKTGENNFGMGFNIITDIEKMDHSLILTIKKIIGVIGSEPGTVTTGGFNTEFPNLVDDIRTDWLGGGYTVWSRNILGEFFHKPVSPLHAAGEDLRFSYPIGKKYHLYACSAVKVMHNENEISDWKKVRYRSKCEVIARLYFCAQHEEMSVTRSIVSGLTFRLLDVAHFELIPWIKLLAFIEGALWFLVKRRYGIEVLDVR